MAGNVHDWETSVLCSASAYLLCCLIEKPKVLSAKQRQIPSICCLSFLFLFGILKRQKFLLNFSYLRVAFNGQTAPMSLEGAP